MDCYCVCHSPLSSCAWCVHCQGDNAVARYHRQRRLEREQAERNGAPDGPALTDERPLVEIPGTLRDE